MEITITVNNVQHIKKQELSFDLSKNRLLCITGKNSIGKTTFIRAIRNLPFNNTFQDTAAPYIFNENSSIIYKVDGLEFDIEFKYNRYIKSVDSKQEIPESLKSQISVELPIPHGERFNHFRRLSDIDEELRAKIAVGDYRKPDELISFLNKIYKDNRFDSLKQVDLNRTAYYFILKDDEHRYYVREDYLSSGEYFVISLYKQIKQNKRLIVIDEIDISLDACAQANLVKVLREFCREYQTNIVFTTHSLALMKTLNVDELHYMELNNESGIITSNPRSYNFVKSIMYGFKGSDKYILTEDKCLEEYIEYLISKADTNTFFKYRVIYIGGGAQVIDLLKRNNSDNFLSSNDNILAVLDGDQKDKNYLNGIDNVLILPFDSIEKKLYQRYREEDENIPRVDSIEGGNDSKRGKNLFNKLTAKYDDKQLMSEEMVYEYLEKLDPNGVEQFRNEIISFLNP